MSGAHARSKGGRVRLRRWTLALAVLAAVGLPGVARAQVTPAGGTAAGDDTQVIRVGAVISYDFTYQKLPKVPDAAANQISPTSFNVARAYINITGNISHVVSFRITPDLVVYHQRRDQRRLRAG